MQCVEIRFHHRTVGENVVIYSRSRSCFMVRLLLSVAEAFVRTSEELDWLHCTVSGLNFHYPRSWVDAPHGPPNGTQRKALNNLPYEVRVLREQCAGLIPDIDWGAELTSAATSYDGEVVFPAEPLDYDLLLEVLPPREACAAVRAVDATEGWIRAAPSDPGLFPKDESELGSLSPAPKVWASNEEWGLITGDLLEKGTLETIEYEYIVEGDMPMLPHSDKWKSVILRSGEVMLWSAEDLTCYLYVYSLRDVWLKYMAISKPVRRCIAGPPGKGMICLAAVVMPMGWISATRLDILSYGNFQRRRSCAGTLVFLLLAEVGHTCDDDGWMIYIGRGSSSLQLAPSKWGHPFRIRGGLDKNQAIELLAEHLEKSPDLLADLSSLSGARLLCHCKEHQLCHGDVLIAKWLERFNVYIVNLEVPEITNWWRAKALQGAGISEAVDLARRGYEYFSVPRSENKAVIHETTTQSLREFVRRLISLTLATLQRPTVTQKWMQILAMMCVTHLWRFLVTMRGDAKLPRRVREELVSALTLLPLLRCDLRVPISGLVAVSDASMQRGAVCRAVRLRPDGVAAARAASRRLVTDFRDEVVLLSLFDGIGGARRALDLLGLTPALFLSAEIDAEAKRVTKYAWPDVLESGETYFMDSVKHVVIPDGPGPVEHWLAAELQWQDDIQRGCRLPTFLRYVLRRAPGRFPTGLDRCAGHELERWREFDYRFAPFFRTPTAADYLSKIHSVRQMRETGGGATVADATVSTDQVDCDEGVLVRQHDLESEDAALNPGVIIVEELARRAEAGSSDIRLDTFEAMRPDLRPRRPVSVARWTWNFLRKERILPASWKLLRAWQRLELPQRVLPVPDIVLTAMAATARGWGRNDVAALLALGFAAFSRTTETLTLRRWQVAIDEATRGGEFNGAQPPRWRAREAPLDNALVEAAGLLGPEASWRVRELEQLAQQRHPGLTPAPVQPPSAPPAPAASPVPPSAPPPPPAERPPAQQHHLSPEDLEESSNSYFSRIYTGEMTVPQLVEVMKDFASHEKGNWKHEVYSRMISNLFDECRFFPKYPPQELTITGELFGLLIKNDLVHASNLGLALRCVLEALRRPMHTKMFKFGILALEQFLDRLPVWPALCQHLTQIQDLSEAYPTYVQYVKDILNALPEELRNAMPGPQLAPLKQETLQNYEDGPPGREKRKGGAR
ncbi:unnamed protein product [Prorocentrum cordatum]|uniref:CCR4-NOT transcription complex subunit 1 n=1 Tax=Prorocentrum cordatum TaxID=2364126 RepID=A0ABN9REF7_9DINO|nr:unnamed protein product [Polarella glacialis]